MAIDIIKHKTLIAKAEKLGIDYEFYDNIEDLKADCREQSKNSWTKEVLEVQASVEKLKSKLFLGATLGEDLTPEKIASAEKYQKANIKFMDAEDRYVFQSEYRRGLLKKMYS
jgi:hypothetical protein